MKYQLPFIPTLKLGRTDQSGVGLSIGSRYLCTIADDGDLFGYLKQVLLRYLQVTPSARPVRPKARPSKSGQVDFLRLERNNWFIVSARSKLGMDRLSAPSAEHK
ncbi:hypothetical protein [Pseudotabrizicola sp. 4114]|uniref:hypothetical protein n=1 Tax=Pseudotabrizicola sp. 4114 TaxID=2817731 RepID=UPI002865C9BA|nr:hypothetical protein [Pseudorhodobacter sp. 4114]